MASTNFIDGLTVISSSWLNDVNTAVYTTVPANTAALATKVDSTYADSTYATKASPSFTGSGTIPTFSVSTLLQIPTWATAGRPANGTGRIGYNSDLSLYEGNTGSAWKSFVFKGDPVTYGDGTQQTTAFLTSMLGFRNLVQNASYNVDQRGNAGGVTVPVAVSTYPVDRFFVYCDTQSSSAQRSPNAAGTLPSTKGVLFSLTWTNTASAGSPAAGHVNTIQHRIEGTLLRDLRWGTADARSLGVSFYTYVSTAGTYSFALKSAVSGVDSRSYVTSYPLNSGWNFVSFLIPGDTTSGPDLSTGRGFTLVWDLGSGSTAQTSTANSWVAGNYNRLSGTASPITVASSQVAIAGVQLELDRVTEFEKRQFVLEQLVCQRYYLRRSSSTSSNERLATAGVSSTATTAIVYVQFPVQMRAAPTFSAGNATNANIYDGTLIAVTSMAADTPGIDGSAIVVSTGSGQTVGRSVQLARSGSVSPAPYLEFSAEL